MLLHLLQGAVALAVWIVANVVYVDLRRKGVHGFTRFAAFWAGTPTTWVWLFTVEEGTRPTLEPSEGDDAADLLLEIRRDRQARLDSVENDDGPSEETPSTS